MYAGRQRRRHVPAVSAREGLKITLPRSSSSGRVPPRGRVPGVRSRQREAPLTSPKSKLFEKRRPAHDLATTSTPVRRMGGRACRQDGRSIFLKAGDSHETPTETVAASRYRNQRRVRCPRDDDQKLRRHARDHDTRPLTERREHAPLGKAWSARLHSGPYHGRNTNERVDAAVKQTFGGCAHAVGLSVRLVRSCVTVSRSAVTDSWFWRVRHRHVRHCSKVLTLPALPS